MAIKRKDGSIYKLRGPNPIMVKQSFWDTDKSIVHNLNPEEIVTKESEPDPEAALQDLPSEEIHVSIKDVEVSKLPPNTNKKKRVIPKTVPKELVHILPAMIKEYRDPLYDEVRSTISYGAKFTMEVVIATQDDLVLVLWTNSSEVNKGSIIYTPSSRRWWRVSETSKRNEGFMFTCLPSDLQPSFE